MLFGGVGWVSVNKLLLIEVLRTTFLFGYCDSGTLFSHSESHSIWLIYGEMYTELVADSFEWFMEKWCWIRNGISISGCAGWRYIKGCSKGLEQPLNVFQVVFAGLHQGYLKIGMRSFTARFPLAASAGAH